MLRFGESIGVDLVALSFVRTPEDVTSVREHTRLPLIAKIEKPQAMDAAEEIIRVADCVMVARGDLGIELPIQEVPPRAEETAAARRTARAPRRSPPRRCLDSMVLLTTPHASRGHRRGQRDLRRHRRRNALAGDRRRAIPG